jgi:hypothetical protein
VFSPPALYEDQLAVGVFTLDLLDIDRQRLQL